MRGLRLRKVSEHTEQCELFKWAEIMAPSMPELSMLFAVPNGFVSTPAQKAKMKREGLKSGVPDICLAVPAHNYHGLFIEMKLKGNAPTPKQKQWHAKLRGWGYCVKVCHDWIEASELIVRYTRGAHGGLNDA